MKVGTYSLERELGRGGMGVVWRVRDARGRLLALKVLRAPSREARDRFDRERRLLAGLGVEHGFVPLVDSGDGPHGPYVVMPLLEGGTLRSRIDEGPLPIDRAVALVRQLAAALGRAHALGIVHRDLKPENVLFDAQGRPFVADLGLAKHFRTDAPGASQTLALTRTGEAKGTVGYAAPEQLSDAAHVSPAADVFALGAILHECVTGEPAFSGASGVEVVARVLAGTRERITSLRPGAPAWLERVVAAALATDPSKRYADGGQLDRALADAAGAPPRRASARTFAVAGALLMAAGAAGVAAALLAPRAEPAAPAVGPTPGAAAPAPSFRALCSGFLSGRTFELTDVWGSYRWRVGTRLRAIRFSPDGKLVVSGGWDDEAKLWDAATGEQVGRLVGHRLSVNVLSWLADGTLVTGSDDGSYALWDVPTRVCRRKVAIGEKPISALAASPDGGLIALANEAGRVELRRVADDGVVFGLDLPAHVTGLAFAPDGSAWAAGARDGSLVLRDRAGEIVRVLAPVGAQVDGCAFFPDGKRLVTGSHDRTLTVWDVATGGARKIAGHEGPVTAVAVSHDARRLVSSSVDRTVRIWDAASERPVARIEHHATEVLAVATSRAGLIASAGADGRIGVFDLSGRDVRARADPADALPTSIALAPDGRFVAVGSDGGTIRRFDLERGVELTPVRAGRSPAYVAIAPGGKSATACALDGGVYFWSDARLDGPAQVEHPSRDGWSATYLDDRTVATGHESGTRLWVDRRLARTVANHEPGAHAAYLFRAGLLACRCGTILRFDGTTLGERFGSLAPSPVAIFEAGERVHVASTAGELRSWERSGAPVSQRRVGEWLYALARSPSGRIAGAVRPKAIVLLEEDGSVRDTIDLSGASDHGSHLAFTPDGRSLLVATARGVVLRFRLR